MEGERICMMTATRNPAKMVLIVLVAAAAAALPITAAAEVAQSCPPVTAATTPQRSLITSLDDTTSTAASLILPLTSSDVRTGATDETSLCTLTRLVSSVHVPIARSYDGRAWQLTAGAYLSTTTLTCDGVEEECIISGLDGIEGEYYLTSYHRPSVSSNVLAARFLERTTFGPKLEEIQSLSASISTLGADDDGREALAAYTHNQIYDTPISSHRAYYRRHLVPRTTSSYPYALAGPHPCDQNSRWRRFAFTTKDVELSRFSQSKANGDAPFGWDWNPFYKVRFEEWTSPSDGNVYYLVKYGKWIRTVLDALPGGQLMDTAHPRDKYARIDVTLKTGVDYTLCDVMEFVGTSMPTGKGYINGVEWSLFIAQSSCILGNECTTVCEDLNERIMVVGGNPEVLMHPDLLVGGAAAADAEGGVQAVDMTAEGANVEEIREGGIEVLYTGSTFAETNAAVCDAIMDPAEVCFWADTWGNQRTGDYHTNTYDKTRFNENALQPVFARLPGGDSSTYALFDARPLLVENTIDAPAPDGGGSAMIRSAHGEDHLVTMCANAPYTPFNEDGCRLSHDDNACVNAKLQQVVGGGNWANVLKYQDYLPVYRGASGGGVVVCGSENEVAPDPTSSDSFDLNNMKVQSDAVDYDDQKRNVWTQMALTAPDQLGQRMAFALSQIFSISPPMLTDPWGTEPNVNFYDIFVMHGLKNYRDVLKRVSFNPKMGEMLTFNGNRAVQYEWNNDLMPENGRNPEVDGRTLVYPDENYAREIMQLYTIGLVELNVDGTEKLDRFGRVIETYGTKEVMSLAKLWTGLEMSHRRGNLEEAAWESVSRVDPLQIYDVRARDWFPKMGLRGKYVGDGYPLCVDLPRQHFLRKGARYRLLGGSKRPHWQSSDPTLDDSAVANVIDLTGTGSSLYTALCSADAGECTFPPIIELTDNIPCDGSVTIEGGVDDFCNLSSLRTVKVDEVYYEYLRQPCINFPFFGGSKMVWKEPQKLFEMCADPRLPQALSTCCGDPSVYTWKGARLYKTYADFPCAYRGERVDYGANEDRCLALYDGDPFSVCTPDRAGFEQNGVYTQYDADGNYGAEESFCEYGGQSDRLKANTDTCCNDMYERVAFGWSTTPCNIKVKVDPDGLVAVVHENTNPAVQTMYHVDVDEGISFFDVVWNEASTRDSNAGDFPSVPEASCTVTAGCKAHGSAYCLCDVTVLESAVFQGPDLPSRDDILSLLHVGAFDIDTFDAGEYVSFGTLADVSAWAPKGSSAFTKDTVFSTTDVAGNTKFYRNLLSTVSVGGGIYSFRNAPTFHDLVDPEVRDAYYEIDAALDTYLHHPNTAPFVSKNLIKHFGTSNPSPAYVKSVAEAFQSGTYQVGAYVFGEGKWGDLTATAAAILLESEGLSASLDVDPTTGSMAAPLNRVVGFMRSMEFTRTGHSRLTDSILAEAVQGLIGQHAHTSPDQFSFFSPEFVPPGAFSIAKLVAPEAGVSSINQVIGRLNGLAALIHHGLNACPYGAGMGFNTLSFNPCNSDIREPDRLYEDSTGYLNYEPDNVNDSAAVVDMLSLLLTSGRLSSESRQIVVDAYDAALTADTSRPDIALKIAQELIASTPEFHSTSLTTLVSEDRPPTPRPPPSGDVGYKAIVHLYLFGGADTFNLLVPGPTCPLFDEYKQVRGENVALDPLYEIVTIDASSSDQPCAEFGVNKNIDFLKTLYDNGAGVFFANAGHLNKPVTKSNYKTETRSQLFSHYHQKIENHLVDAFRDEPGTGVLGRMLDVLEAKSMSVGSIAIDRTAVSLAGNPLLARSIDVMSNWGPIDLLDGQPPVDTFVFDTDSASPRGKDTLFALMADLNGNFTATSGIFGELWSQKFVDSEQYTDAYTDVLDAVTVASSFGNGRVGRQLEMVTKVIKARVGRGVNRDAFHVEVGGFDHHANAKSNFNAQLLEINGAIEGFWSEMEAEGLTSDVVFVMSSEFGRTMTPNSGQGTDHAWGGNYFMASGAAKGGKILGEYPSTFFDDDDAYVLPRGRTIPTTSWDAIWHGISHWFDITDDADLDYVLPNRGSHGCNLFSDFDLFTSGSNNIAGCGGVIAFFDQVVVLPEERHLDPDEQRSLCDVYMSYASSATTLPTNCVVKDQTILQLLDANNETTYEVTINLEIPSDDEAIEAKLTSAIQAPQFDVDVQSIIKTGDENECENETSGCEQVCVDLVPGFECACNAGYTLDETDGKSCIADPDATSAPTRAPSPSVPVNLAFTGLATQSSTCFGAVASRAIDGNADPRWTRDSISHTCSERGSWWQVELVEPSLIDFVEVFNRMDSCCQHYLGGRGGAKVQLLDYDEGGDLVAVASADIGISEGVSRFHFPFKQQRASAVRIQKDEAMRGTLPIAEVVVMGTAGNLPAATPLQNLAAARTNTAEQSSTCFGGGPYKAIDGRTSGFWSDKSISHTCSGTGNYWQTVFETPALVSYVDLYNRLDSCCSHYLSGATVELLDYDQDGDLIEVGTALPLGDSRGVPKFHLVFNNRRASGIRVSKDAATRGVLGIAEAVVVGTVPSDMPPPEPIVNLAKKGEAISSSVCFRKGPYKAIDQKIKPYIADNSMFHSCSGYGEWMIVKFKQASGSVDYVDVYNRLDSCCSPRLSGATVELLDYVDGNEPGELVVVASSPPIADSTDIPRFRFPFNGVRASAARVRQDPKVKGVLTFTELVVMGTADAGAKA